MGLAHLVALQEYDPVETNPIETTTVVSTPCPVETTSRRHRAFENIGYLVVYRRLIVGIGMAGTVKLGRHSENAAKLIAPLLFNVVTNSRGLYDLVNRDRLFINS
jgi:hypothetical protein